MSANSHLPVRDIWAESPVDDLLPSDCFEAFGFPDPRSGRSDFELLDSRWGDWPPYSDRLAIVTCNVVMMGMQSYGSAKASVRGIIMMLSYWDIRTGSRQKRRREIADALIHGSTAGHHANHVISLDCTQRSATRRPVGRQGDA